MTPANPAARKWVSDRFLAERYEVSRATVWRWARTGKLPKPQRLGENTVRWDLQQADSSVLGDTAA